MDTSRADVEVFPIALLHGSGSSCGVKIVPTVSPNGILGDFLDTFGNFSETLGRLVGVRRPTALQGSILAPMGPCWGGVWHLWDHVGEDSGVIWVSFWEVVVIFWDVFADVFPSSLLMPFARNLWLAFDAIFMFF